MHTVKVVVVGPGPQGPAAAELPVRTGKGRRLLVEVHVGPTMRDPHSRDRVVGGPGGHRDGGGR
jgi:hypothetical protein